MAYYRTLFSQDKHGGCGAEQGDKAPPWVMLRPWSDSIQPTPLDPGTRPLRRRVDPSRAKPAAPRVEVAQNQAVERTFPAWARLADPSAAGADAGFEAAFRAGAGLALFDWILAGRQGAEPAFAGALRQRLALRAATACAWMARLREDERALRDAEHLSPNASGNAPTSPAGRIHRLWRGFAAPSVGFDEPSLRKAADLLELPRDLDLEALAEALRRLFQGEENPLAAAARAGSTTARMLDGAPRAETEILALWLTRSVLARKLGWDAPIALLATSVAHAVVAVGGPATAAPGRRRLAAPLRRGCRARRAGGSWARRRSFSAIGEAVERRAKAEGERGGASDRNAARRRRGFSGDRGESREAVGSRQPAVCSIGWSSSASRANCRGGPVFGSTAYRDQR